MSQIVKFLTPKQRFCENDAQISAHRDTLQEVAFENAIHAALLEYQRLLTSVPTENFNLCAASHLKITGVHEFLKIFWELAETPGPLPKSADRNLDHRL